MPFNSATLKGPRVSVPTRAPKPTLLSITLTSDKLDRGSGGGGNGGGATNGRYLSNSVSIASRIAASGEGLAILNATLGNAVAGVESGSAGPSKRRTCRGERELDRLRRKNENECPNPNPLATEN